MRHGHLLYLCRQQVYELIRYALAVRAFAIVRRRFHFLWSSCLDDLAYFVDAEHQVRYGIHQSPVLGLSLHQVAMRLLQRRQSPVDGFSHGSQFILSAD